MQRTASSLYFFFMWMLGTLNPLYFAWRGDKEDAVRQGERRGGATRPRPDGRLLWVHGASVGETLSALPLLECLLGTNQSLSVLMTSGTRSSARMLASRLPARAFHQYLPLDVPGYAQRFIRHWRPDAVLWLESDLWPILLGEVRRAHIPAALVNARMSEKSARGWLKWAPQWIEQVLSTFQLALTQTPLDAERLQKLGLANAVHAGNLKYTAPRPAYDAAAYAELKIWISERPIWLMASTHDGEEDIALEMHRELVMRWPDLLTIIIPRHVPRADAVAALFEDTSYSVERRSAGQPITPQTGIYLADTMGEMGLFYHLAPIVCIGGSFVDEGGHNPIEPAQCGAAVLCGPDMRNIRTVADELINAGAMIQVRDAAELVHNIARLLDDKSARLAMQQAGLKATARQSAELEVILSQLAPVLTRAGLATL